MHLLERLHDEVDAEEELREEARATVADVRLKLPDIVAKLGFDDGMRAITELVAERLADLTTRAAKIGAKHALERRK